MLLLFELAIYFLSIVVFSILGCLVGVVVGVIAGIAEAVKGRNSGIM